MSIGYHTKRDLSTPAIPFSPDGLVCQSCSLTPSCRNEVSSFLRNTFTKVTSLSGKLDTDLYQQGMSLIAEVLLLLQASTISSHLAARSICFSDRCIPDILAESEGICISPVLSGGKMLTKAPTGKKLVAPVWPWYPLMLESLVDFPVLLPVQHCCC